MKFFFFKLKTVIFFFHASNTWYVFVELKCQFLFLGFGVEMLLSIIQHICRLAYNSTIS